MVNIQQTFVCMFLHCILHSLSHMGAGQHNDDHTLWFKKVYMDNSLIHFSEFQNTAYASILSTDLDLVLCVPSSTACMLSREGMHLYI